MKRTLVCLVATALLLSAGNIQAGEPDPHVAMSPDAVHPLLIGATIPRATLLNIDGSPFDLNAAVAEQPAILIFYRGGW